MKNRYNILTSTFVVIAMTQSLRAADASWSLGTGGGNWSEDSAWSPAVAPGAATGTTNTDTATFDSSTRTTNSTIAVDAGRNIGSITFNTTNTFGYSLGSGFLVLSSGGTTQTTGNGAGQNTVNTGLTLQGSYTFTANSNLQLNTANATITTAESLGGVTLNVGGTVAVPDMTLLVSGGGAGGGSGTVNLHGDMRKITSAAFSAHAGVSLNVHGSGSLAYSGANIDNTGLSVPFNSALLHSGPNIIDGGLTKAGHRPLILPGDRTYTGATKASADVLAVDGCLADSSTTVAGSARLQGSGSIGGALTVQNGGVIAAGSSITTLSTAALTLEGGLTLAYRIANNALGGVPGGFTAATGNLALDVPNTAHLSLSELGAAGTWTVGAKLTHSGDSATWHCGPFDYGGTLTDDSILDFSGMDWRLNYDDTSAGDNHTDILAGSSIVTMIAAPEPSAELRAALGALGLAARRRRSA